MAWMFGMFLAGFIFGYRIGLNIKTHRDNEKCHTD